MTMPALGSFRATTSRGGNTAADTTSTLASQNQGLQLGQKQGRNPKFVVNKLEPLQMYQTNRRKQVALTVGSIEDKSIINSSIDQSTPEKRGNDGGRNLLSSGLPQDREMQDELLRRLNEEVGDGHMPRVHEGPSRSTQTQGDSRPVSKVETKDLVFDKISNLIQIREQ